MAERKASDVFVQCLEAEGVEYVFGIPGEETLDLSESLADSSIQFVPVRHEQGGAYMADAIGRLTGRAGVCLGTLGPGATNLVTAVADSFLDRAPLVALTGQSDLERMHKESHQYIDLIGILRPVVKWNARVSSPEIIPEVVRKAFKVAESEMAGFDDADLVITIGYDLVEHSPEHWNPHGNKKIVVIDSVAAEIDEFYMPEVELIGDIAHVLARLAASSHRPPVTPFPSCVLHEMVIGAFNDARDDDHFPMRPARVLSDIREVLGPQDMLISDVGLHKLWIGRMFPAHEPGTVLIANGLAGMGFALPTASAAKLVYPHRKVVTVSGDGGFLMNCQELETAVRLRTPVVNVVWENGEFGSIAWKQDKKFGRHFDVGFGNPDFVKLAESFGMPAWRCSNADEFGQRLRHALALDLPSLIVVPIDYSIDVALYDQLGAETVAT